MKVATLSIDGFVVGLASERWIYEASAGEKLLAPVVEGRQTSIGVAYPLQPKAKRAQPPRSTKAEWRRSMKSGGR